MNKIKGPGIFLAQFLRDVEPFNNINTISKWAADLGYKGVQIPTWSKTIFDLDLASKSRDYCDNYKANLESAGLEIIELASYLQGQVMAIHPAYELLFQSFYPKELDDNGRLEWASEELRKTIIASANFGTKNISVLSGGFAWPYMYPWPQRPEGMIEEAFRELAKRWLPILNFAQDAGITIGFELHPGSDLCDGSSFLRFLDMVHHHSAACITYDPSHFVLQQLDYIEFIRIFSNRIKAFHVKDAEFQPTGLVGVYGGFNNWVERAGRFRSPGDGHVNFKRIFSTLTEYGYEGWAILEWECCIKGADQGASESAGFIGRHIIDVAEYAFDDFANAPMGDIFIRKALGITADK